MASDGFSFSPRKIIGETIPPIDGIEEGLQWLVKNCKKVGIKSIAMPALGCGLGGLHWKDVGPLMCKYPFTITGHALHHLSANGGRPIERVFIQGISPAEKGGVKSMSTLDFKGKSLIYAHHLTVPSRALEVDAKKSFYPPPPPKTGA